MEEIIGKKGNLFKALQCVVGVSKDLKDQVQKTNLTKSMVLNESILEIIFYIVTQHNLVV